MNEARVFKWLLEIEVPEYWMKGGFEFHEGRCQDVAESVIGYAYRDPVRVRVVQGPDTTTAPPVD